ncbi:unnamed protein product [Scytosiphon promiscuus]
MEQKLRVEELVTTLRDLWCKDILFGMKSVLMSGDWRQTSPIVQFGSAADSIDADFITSDLWPPSIRICVLRYTWYQRDKDDASYASFVQSIGEGRQPMSRFPDGAEMTPLTNFHDESTDDNFTLQYTTDFDYLISFVYPDFSEDTRLLKYRAILATTSASIDTSNDTVATKRPGIAATFYTSDTVISDEPNADTAFASPEHLNHINDQGIPPRELNHKILCTRDNC